MVVGHTCQIALEDDGMLDVWICNPKDVSVGLGTEAVRNRLSPFQSCGSATVCELTGEGYARGRVEVLVSQFQNQSPPR